MLVLPTSKPAGRVKYDHVCKGALKAIQICTI